MGRRVHALVLAAVLSLALAACRGPNQAATVAPSPTPRAGAEDASSLTTASPVTSAPGACPATPFQTEPFPEAGLGGVPWVRAVPADVGITAHLFRLRTADPRRTQPLQAGRGKILWEIRDPRRGDTLEITGRNLAAPGQTLRETAGRALSPDCAYPSDVTFPGPGCWRLDLASGELAATVTFLVIVGAGSPTPGASPTPAVARTVELATPGTTPGAWGPPFRLTAGQARAVATVVAFLEAYNAGQLDAALALLADDVVGSDCDYREGRVILFQGKDQAVAWLRARLADHDRLIVAAIWNDNADQPMGAHVVGVEYARRTSDTLRALGFPAGITPQLATKVGLTPTDDRIQAFANGPGGGSPDACWSVPGTPGTADGATASQRPALASSLLAETGERSRARGL